MDDDNISHTDIVTSPDGSRTGPRGARVSVGDLYRLLASDRRRLLLSQLATRFDDSVTVDELVDAVAEREHPDPGPATHRVRILIDLHHVHLPKLADAGIVDYDPVAETVRYCASEQLESLLASREANERTEDR